MSVFGKVIDFLGGGIAETIINTATKYFPPSLSDADKKKIEQAIRQSARDHEIKLLEIAHNEQQEFNDRIKEMEGTSGDLIKAGPLGKVIIFLRGAQRPIWGYFVLIMDFMVFSGKWDLCSAQGETAVGVDMVSAFWIINLLVLGFLFGERAVRNVLPLIEKKLGKQQEAKG